MLINVILTFAFLFSSSYVIYFFALNHFCRKEYMTIFEMYRKGTEQGLNMMLPPFSVVSFSNTYSDYKAAKLYNKENEKVYKEILQLESNKAT